MLQVNFCFVLAQFQIKKSCFSQIFPTCVQFCTQIVVFCFVPSQQPTLLYHLEMPFHVLSRILYTLSQVPKIDHFHVRIPVSPLLRRSKYGYFWNLHTHMTHNLHAQFTRYVHNLYAQLTRTIYAIRFSLARKF